MKVSLSYHFYQKMPSHLFSRPFSQESYQSIILINFIKISLKKGIPFGYILFQNMGTGRSLKTISEIFVLVAIGSTFPCLT